MKTFGMLLKNKSQPYIMILSKTFEGACKSTFNLKYQFYMTCMIYSAISVR
jgi:hypothetical protein